MVRAKVTIISKIKGEKSSIWKTNDNIGVLFLNFDGVTFRMIILATEPGCVIMYYPGI